MKKIISMILCVMLLSALAVFANAEAINMAGGCTTEVTVKKADASVVIKDGIIGEGEYIEAEVNRDPLTTDLLFSWHPDAALFASCEEFLNNVHFYFSWDEVNGLNMAVKATLLETPVCTSPQPADDAMNDGQGNYYPGDEFLFQFGAMFKFNDGPDAVSSDIVLYRGLGYNTETNTALEGHYGRHGHTGTYKLAYGSNYMVKLDGNTVTYEISVPLADVLTATQINGKAPVDGTSLYFDVTATGGSTGTSVGDAMCYAVSLGDGGYMMSNGAGTDLKSATAIFSNDTIVDAPVVEDTTVTTDTPDTTVPAPATSEKVTTPAPTQEATTQIVTDVVTSYVEQTDDDGNVVTDGDGNAVTDVVSEVITSIVTEAPTQAPDGNKAPVTGDPMVIAAVVAAISACGVVVAKKRK